jgi:hypothetical protein
MRRFGGMTRSERFAASTGQVSPLPIPLPLQNEVVDERRLLTVPWVSLFQWILNVGTRTFVTGTHAERVDPDDPKYDPANFRPGTWFWETDRTVLYQVRIIDDAPQWVYVLGTMTGTLTPDQQPDDLGTYDAGFQFVASDTGQSFFWDGTAWIDITAYPYTVYGTHAERLAQDVDALADGALWCETDRGQVLYQLQAGVWWYIAGTMFGTLIPDERPIDLGVHDGGFDFRTSTPPSREFLWSQTAWVEVTSQPGDVQIASPSGGSITLTTTYQDIGVALTLNRAGRYYLNAVFDMRISGADLGVFLLGQCVADGAALPKVTFFSSAGGYQGMVSQQWVYTASAPGKVVKLQASKSGGSGSSITGSESTLTALWVSA